MKMIEIIKTLQYSLIAFLANSNLNNALQAYYTIQAVRIRKFLSYLFYFQLQIPNKKVRFNGLLFLSYMLNVDFCFKWNGRM